MCEEYTRKMSYDTSMVRRLADKYLKSGSPSFDSVEELVKYWIDRWKDKLSPMKKSLKYSARVHITIWIEILNFFITKESYKYEEYQKLHPNLYLYDSELRYKISSLLAYHNIADSLVIFWETCLQELNEWLDNLGFIKSKDMNDHVLKLFYEIFEIQIINNEFPLLSDDFYPNL